ncbi:MAG TPA: hypothetical protein VFQ85_04830 [Mycobacteriales bacterium]|nr:hypothetical protein [Mycobacteriales bacterium]
MIEIKVRFWTDSIAEGKAKIVPKHAWDAGVVRIERNASHGIAPTAPIPFNGMAELSAKIEKVLIDNGVHLHLGSRARKYLTRG